MLGQGLLQMTTDELSTYGAESDEWNAKVVPFDTVNEVMDDLLNGRNTNNWRYVLTWQILVEGIDQDEVDV